MQNGIDLAFCKWLKWSRVELVRKAVKLCSLSLRATICNNTLHGSHAKLSRCNQTLVAICVSNLAYKWSILTSLKISGTIEGTRRRFQPAKWQSIAWEQPRSKLKPICIAQHIWWNCWLLRHQQTDFRRILSAFKLQMTKLKAGVGFGGGGGSLRNFIRFALENSG